MNKHLEILFHRKILKDTNNNNDNDNDNGPSNQINFEIIYF